MKIAFVNGVNSDIDSSRGIGAHTNALITEFEKSFKDRLTIVNKPEDADITHYTKFNPFFISLPFVKPSKKIVLTIHDLIPLIYPKHYPPGIRGSINFLINKFLIWKNVDVIVTISETSKKDICRFLNIDPKIVNVIYIAPKKVVKKLGIGDWSKKLKDQYNLPNHFVLFDHGVNFNKNIPILIEACKIAKLPLAVVGKEIENIGKLDLNHAELRHLKGVDFSQVIKLGFVSDEELNELFNLADCYVQPSLYEGFGMPILEAMTVGCPVVVAKTQALVEIGEDACLFADPNNANDMAEKILQVVNNKAIREDLVKKGFALVKKFSWQKTAKETLEVYESL